VKFKLGIIILFLCQITKAQQSEMTVNQNLYNPDFIANSELKKEFENQKNENTEFTLIAKSNIEEKISVFIKNNSSNNISFSHQDHSIYIIQEAMNENGVWKPIEYWESSDCGNSFGDINIEPNGIIETKTTEYQGDFKTKIRFKLNANDKLFYSNAIDGNINANKFIEPEDFSFLWPLAIIPRLKRKTPIELQRKVVFLEPNGSKEFSDFYETILGIQN